MNIFASFVLLTAQVFTVASPISGQDYRVAALTRGTAVVTSYLPRYIAIGADSGGRRKLQGSREEASESVCKIAAAKGRYLLSFNTMDIQNDASDPNDHLLKRAYAIVTSALPGEPVESMLWKIAQRESKAMVLWNEQEPRFFSAQNPTERGPAITLAHMDENGDSEVLIVELRMEEHELGKFVPTFAIRSVHYGEIAFGAKAATVREELLANQTTRAHLNARSLTALDRANTPRKLRKAIKKFIGVAKDWYPKDVFGKTDIAVLTPAGVDLSGVKRSCK